MDWRRGVNFIGVTVCFVVHDGKGNILLQKRSKNTRDEQGTWDIGGGAVEFGEMLDEAVRREVEEELCVKPNKVEFLRAFEAHRDNNGTPTHWIALSHAVEIDPEAVKIGEQDRIDEFGWFDFSNLPSPLHSMFELSYSVAKERGIVK